MKCCVAELVFVIQDDLTNNFITSITTDARYQLFPLSLDELRPLGILLVFQWIWYVFMFCFQIVFYLLDAVGQDKFEN